jgi:hypothetical protein
MNPLQIQTYSRSRDVVGFARDVLGLKDIEKHVGQCNWLRNSWRLINILKPANQWGKTLAESILHIYHAMYKPMLIGRIENDTMWSGIRYETVNVGKTYEVAKGVFETIMDIVDGKVLMNDGTTNQCDLGWAIAHVEDAMNKPPEIHWWNGSKTLIRSYDEFGSSFKRKRLAFVSVDETGDIPELKQFLNGTLIPRVFFFRGPIHLVGTSQPAGVEYEEVAEIAKDAYEKDPDGSDYYFQTGSVFENPNIDPEFLRKLEAVTDPEFKKQIIYGQYIDYGDHIYSFDEIVQVFSEALPYDETTGFTEAPVKDGQYVCAVDMAATKDETSITIVRHNMFQVDPDGKKKELPYRVVFHKAFKGNTMPLSMQYEMVHHWFNAYKSVSPNGTKFVFDSVALGGKNAEQAFSDLHGFPFPGTGSSYMNAKAEAIGTLKDVVGRHRKFKINEAGKQVDENKTWGMLRISPQLIPLRRQIEAYKLDDKNLRQDRFMSLVMAIHYIEKRKPNLSHNRAVDLDVTRGLSLWRN